MATRFLVDIPAIESDTRENIAYHMAFAHQSVAEASRMYLESVRRYNYTTPKVDTAASVPWPLAELRAAVVTASTVEHVVEPGMM